jgi:inorganic pyrophosphatase
VESSASPDHPNARQVDTVLAVPVGHQPCHLEGLGSTQCDAELARQREPDQPLPQGGWVRGEGGHVERDARLGVVGEVFDELFGEGVERIAVFPQLLGRAGKCLGDAGAEFPLEQRQHCRAHAHASEGRVGVLRVGPGLESGVGAGLHSGRAADTEQRPPVLAANGSHPLQTRGPAAAGQPEQHGLGLVVEGVGEEHGGSAELGRSALESRVACRAGRGLGSPGGRDDDALDEHGGESELAGLLRGASCDIRRAVLQPVVNDDSARAEASTWRLEGDGSGQRERIGAAAEGDEHQRLSRPRRREAVESDAARAAEVGDRGSQSGANRHQLTLLRHPPPTRKSNFMADYAAIIEIPKGSRNKYEVDHETGRVFLDRVLYTSFVYPTDYGFFENTLGLDGDPVDVLVLLDYPLYPGVGLKVRPVGVFNMTDDGGSDAKVIAVPAKDPRWAHIQDVTDIPEYTRKEIEHFFEHYKDLEPNKWVKTEGWGNATEAEAAIVAGLAAYIPPTSH